MPNHLLTLMRVDECLRLNHSSSLVKATPIGPLLKGVMHQLNRGTLGQPQCRGGKEAQPPSLVGRRGTHA